MKSCDLLRQTSSIMTLSDHCTVSRRNGRLIIEIPEDKILGEVGTRDLPGRVLDGEMALNHVAETILHTKRGTGLRPVGWQSWVGDPCHDGADR